MRSRFGFKLALVFAIAAFALTGSTLFAQAGGPARRITAGADLPATCISSVVIRDIFYKSGSNAGLYVCTAPDTWTLQSGLADVVGPAGATDNSVALFDSTTGKLLKSSVVLIDASGNISTGTESHVAFGSVSAGGKIGYAENTGPMFTDETVDFWSIFNMQGLSGNRSYMLPDAAGTIALTSSNVASASTLVAATKGSCTLDGGATATCTATVVSGCTPGCTYNSASIPTAVACSVSGTTLTAVSATTLDTGTVNWQCY